MGWFRNPENRPRVRSFVQQWEERNGLARARDLANIALAVLPLLYLGDILVLAREHYAAFMLPRLSVVLAVVLNHLLLATIGRMPNASARMRRILVTLSLLLTPLAVVGCYTWFLFLPLPQYRWAIVIAHVLIAIFCTLTLHRFWREQYIFNSSCLVLYSYLAFTLPEAATEMTSLALVVLVSAVTAFVYRREFFGFMFMRYESLCTFLPRPIARVAALAQDQNAMAADFATQQRFAVTLCADWRDFQSLTMNRDPTFISNAFEHFYDLVLEHLDLVFPEGGYFVDWNADELFVVFIGELGCEELTTRRALVFANELCVRLHEEARARCYPELLYDIGMASGYGLIGLMGPRSRKKLTVAAAAAGIAKRLETEAKIARKQASRPNPYPILALTPELRSSAESLQGFRSAAFVPITATTKDIEAKTCFLWQFEGAPKIKQAG